MTDSIEKLRTSVPVTLITGFLGSGKTTLILKFLNNPHLGKRILVILNEFGESSGIDKSLSLGADGNVKEEWLELSNGCFCCSIKDMGVKAIENLLKKSSKFDYVLLETTGLADPGPIASMFWLDEALQSELYLDGIVTVVDAKFILKYLNEKKKDDQINEATKQIAMADRIIINKIDLVSQNDLAVLETKIRSINNVAGILQTSRGDVSFDFIFNLHSFDKYEKDPFAHINNGISHSIDSRVKTINFDLIGIIEIKKLEIGCKNCSGKVICLVSRIHFHLLGKWIYSG